MIKLTYKQVCGYKSANQTWEQAAEDHQVLKQYKMNLTVGDMIPSEAFYHAYVNR